MDQVSAGDTARDGVRARRRRMRAGARAQRRTAGPEADRFQTPQWLERSFVLPLTEPEVTDVPSQPMPHHDDFAEARNSESAGFGPQSAEPSAPEPKLTFVRPPSQEIDFARVIRRSDLTRKATRMAMTCTGITGLALIAYLLTASPLVLAVTFVGAVVALVAMVVRVRMTTAPIPHLES